MAARIVSNRCAEQAHSLLRAWQSGDREDLRSELERTLTFCSAPAAGALDGERQELLECVARDMRQAALTRRADDPPAMWVGLLQHLILSAC